MNTKRRVTIREVAQAAGVSIQTVSRVLNEHPDVSPETRNRVRQIIADLGYIPSALARSLIHGRTHTIGVTGYGLSYYGPARILTGVERRANEMGFSLQLNLLREPEANTGEAIFKSLIDRQVEGIIWAVPEIGSNRDWLAQEIASGANRPGVPLVALNMQPVPGVPMAAIDNRAGGDLAARCLIERGCRRIGIITGPDTWWESQRRLQGWRDALQEIGTAGSEQLVYTGDWYPASGERGLKALLEKAPDLDGVFACNDPMALGALQAARQLGRRVPADLAIVGFDDIPEAAYFYPALTTIRQPLVELGAQAVEMLYSLIEEGSPSGETPQVWLPPQLIERESANRPQGHSAQSSS